MKNFLTKNMTVIAVVFAVFGITAPSFALAAGPAAVNLGTAGNFRILAKTLISDANPVISSIVGNVGLSPAAGSSITGISCTEITGSIYDVDGTYTGGHNSNIVCLLAGPGANKTTVDNAVLDMGTAYTAASAPATPAGVGATNLNVGAGTLSGQNFVPATYTWGTNVTITGDITLTGSASDVWIFQINGTLGISANKKIILAGGALASNIFWQVTGAVTLQPGSFFAGNILTQTSIAMQAGANLSGRALAQTAVTLIGNTISSSAPFTTTVPIVFTTSAASITASTGTLNGGVTSTGGSNPTQSGFVYGTTADLASVVATSTLGAQGATFSQPLTDLSQGITYYVRAYATNSAGTGFGSVIPFTTSTSAPHSSSGTSSGGSSGGGSVSVYQAPVSTSVAKVATSTVSASNIMISLAPAFPNSGFPPEQGVSLWSLIALSTIVIVAGYIYAVTKKVA